MSDDIQVSVIVPVYNPGRFIDACIDTLLAQTLPADRLEVIFVDDGSTDDTPARLAELAVEYSQVRVVTIPNSGWPGKPRNVGTEEARGDFLMFMDQDDALEPESLERMHALGAANDADIVLGKVISDFRPIFHDLYREQRPRCDVFTAALLQSLTPHKMLRRTFLLEHDIRYPEGPRRLEDQLFMTQAYFAASAASIVADYVCYRYLKRADGKNAGSKRIDPVGYYGNLREVLDVVDAATTPGEQRDEFYRRFFRTELLGRMTRRDLLSSPGDHGPTLLREVRGLLEERFPLSVDAGLAAGPRVRAALTRTGTAEEIADLTDRLVTVRPDVELTSVRAAAAGQVALEVEVGLSFDGRPLVLEPAERGGWLLPEALTGPGLGEDRRRVEDLGDVTADIVITHRQQLDQWFVPGVVVPTLENGVLALRMQVTLDPSTAAGGAPLRTGVHDLTVRVDAFGLRRNQRLAVPESDPTELPVVVDGSGRVIRCYATDKQNLSIDVAAASRWYEQAAQKSILTVTGTGVEVQMRLTWAHAPTVVLTLESDGGPPVQWPLEAQSGWAGLWAAVVGRERLRLPAGVYRAELTVTERPEAKRRAGRSMTATLPEPLVVDASVRRTWWAGARASASARVVSRVRRRLKSLPGTRGS